MSVLGFRARNHPQQATRDDVDDRATLPEIFDPIADRFGGFTVDAAAAAHNTKCERFWTKKQNGLTQDWAPERVWCNPPYSNIRPWVVKAHESPNLTVMLLPNNRCEQGWWQDLVEPWRDNGTRLTAEFMKGRPRFLQHGQTKTQPNDRPPFGLVLLVFAAADPLRIDEPGRLFP